MAPSLDFCNTLAGWNGGERKNYLAGYDHLAVWAGFAELLTTERVGALRDLAARQGEAAAFVLEQARRVRGRLYELLGDPHDPRRLESFSPDLQTAMARVRLGPADGGIGWEIDPQAGLSAPLYAAVWSAGQLLVSAELRRVRSCPGAGCGWLFVDRTGRRRWCTMATCGNRQKARRFADRRRARD